MTKMLNLTCQRDFRERICKISLNALAYRVRPSGGMADAGDLKSPARYGRVGSTPTSATVLFYDNSEQK